MLAPDGSGYINSFRARLTAGGRPLAGQEVEFRFNTYWNEDGSVNTTAQEDAPDKEQVCTDAEGFGLLLRQCATTASETYTWPTMWT